MKRFAAIFVALGLVLGGLVAGTASPAAASHTTCASGNKTFPGRVGHVQYSMCWLTNSAHTGVKPYYWSATSYMANGETVKFTNQTYVDYPGGTITTANERLLDHEVFSPQYTLSYGQGYGQNANVPMSSPPYALKTNAPTWRIYAEMSNGDRYPVVSRIVG